MIIDISHKISLTVGGSSRAVEHLLLTPLSGPTQTVKEWSIDMPGIETAARFTDAHGNRAQLVSQTRPPDEIRIAITGAVDVQDRNGVIGRLPSEPVVGIYRRATALTEPDPRIVEGFLDADTQGAARIALFHGVMERIGELYSFGDLVKEEQSQSQAAGDQTQSQGENEPPPRAEAAVFAHAFIGTLRALGLPARYVTGYLAADDDYPASFHAWAEAYDDGLGWIAFDAALGLCPTDRHVRVAIGLDALSTAPIRIVPAIGEPRLVALDVEAAVDAAAAQ
jgi:Transglutaminase-like superfamily/Bacterial transglutaminase-like N-terminal region